MFKHDLNIITARMPTSIGVLANVGLCTKKTQLCICRHICNITLLINKSVYKQNNIIRNDMYRIIFLLKHNNRNI